MAKLIFNKVENERGALHGIAKDSVDLTSKGITEPTYKIFDISDDDYNNVRLEKKDCSYNSDGIQWHDMSATHSSETLVDEIVAGLQSHESNTSYNTCIESLKSKSFDNYTYPLTKTIPEIAEDKGVTWVSLLEIK